MVGGKPLGKPEVSYHFCCCCIIYSSIRSKCSTIITQAPLFWCIFVRSRHLCEFWVSGSPMTWSMSCGDGAEARPEQEDEPPPISSFRKASPDSKRRQLPASPGTGTHTRLVLDVPVALVGPLAELLQEAVRQLGDPLAPNGSAPGVGVSPSNLTASAAPAAPPTT